MKRHVWKTMLLGTLVLAFGGCGKDDDPAPEPPDGDEVTVDNVTYTNFVDGLFQTRCSSCHTGSGAGTSQWVFSGYGSVRDNLARINDAVVVRRIMPQNGSLSARELQLLAAWVEKGAPQ
ncbi:c-type cytochrome [Parapedobacter sp. DT-150]|uniref:c-type cytochrome n=1 Tax=Parapedobacter sp. DT-150 TaxID=3396162 RepID=UPI003F1930EA